MPVILLECFTWRVCSILSLWLFDISHFSLVNWNYFYLLTWTFSSCRSFPVTMRLRNFKLFIPFCFSMKIQNLFVFFFFFSCTGAKRCQVKARKCPRSSIFFSSDSGWKEPERRFLTAICRTKTWNFDQRTSLSVRDVPFVYFDKYGHIGVLVCTKKYIPSASAPIPLAAMGRALASFLAVESTSGMQRRPRKDVHSNTGLTWAAWHETHSTAIAGDAGI